MALTDTFVRQVKPTGGAAGGKYRDGDGMYLYVKDAGKYWRMDYRFRGKRKTLAFGVYPEVSLAKARKRRDSARELLADGVGPSEAKRTDKLVSAGAAANTFKVVALEWHAMKAKSTTAGTTYKRLRHLEAHVFASIGNRPIDAVKPPEVLALLRKVEASGTAYTAGRMRKICGQVFRYAIQPGRAEDDPAASMRGAIQKMVTNHRPAITTRREFGELVRDLRDTTRADPLTRLCARFGLLTWTRPKELRQAKWDQLDMDAPEWRIPAVKMKTGKHLQAHTVPLSLQAMALLPALRELSGHADRLFPSAGNAGGVISENTINNLFWAGYELPRLSGVDTVQLRRAACVGYSASTILSCGQGNCQPPVVAMPGAGLWAARSGAVRGYVYACRHCHQLKYRTQRENVGDRAGSKADKLRERLGLEAGILNSNGDKPKGMRWQTFQWLQSRHDDCVNVSLAGAMVRFEPTRPDPVAAKLAR